MVFTAIVFSSFLGWGWCQVLAEDNWLDTEEQIKIWNLSAAAPQGNIDFRQYRFLLILGWQVEMAETSALSVFTLLQMVEFEPKFTHLELKDFLFSLPVSGEITEALKKRQFLMSALLLCCLFVIHGNAFLILPHTPGLKEQALFRVMLLMTAQWGVIVLLERQIIPQGNMLVISPSI